MSSGEVGELQLQIMAWRCKPLAIRRGNGPQDISVTLLHWASYQGPVLNTARVRHTVDAALQT